MKRQITNIAVSGITVDGQWLEDWWLDYHGYFELVLEYLTKSHSADIIVFGIISGDFLFILIMVCCVISLESPWLGDSNQKTQHTFMLKKIERISQLCPPGLAL